MSRVTGKNAYSNCSAHALIIRFCLGWNWNQNGAERFINEEINTRLMRPAALARMQNRLSRNLSPPAVQWSVHHWISAYGIFPRLKPFTMSDALNWHQYSSIHIATFQCNRTDDARFIIFTSLFCSIHRFLYNHPTYLTKDEGGIGSDLFSYFAMISIIERYEIVGWKSIWKGGNSESRLTTSFSERFNFENGWRTRNRCQSKPMRWNN